VVTFFLVLDIILSGKRSNRSATAQRLKYSQQACVRGAVLVPFFRHSALRNAGRRCSVLVYFLPGAVKYQAEITPGRTLVVLGRDSCPREDAGGTRLGLLRELAAVIRAKRTTSKKSLLTHYLGMPRATWVR
jgi:hypothetical protein